MSTIEAMACGTPVVCNKSSSFREVAGEGVKYVGKEEIEIREAILEVLYNHAYRKSIIERDRKQSEKYKWENLINIVRLYESIAFAKCLTAK